MKTSSSCLPLSVSGQRSRRSRRRLTNGQGPSFCSPSHDRLLRIVVVVALELTYPIHFATRPRIIWINHRQWTDIAWWTSRSSGSNCTLNGTSLANSSDHLLLIGPQCVPCTESSHNTKCVGSLLRSLCSINIIIVMVPPHIRQRATINPEEVVED